MKRLFKLAFLVLLMSQVASCGKENSSGSSSSGSTTGISDDGIISGVFSSGDSFGDYSTLQNYYTSASFSNGLSTNMIIYHTGSYFGGQSSSFSASGSYCVNLIFKQWGDCDTNSYSNQLDSIVSQGEYKVVRSSTSSSVTYDIAIGSTSNVYGGEFVYQSNTFNSTDDAYRDMLNLNNTAVHKTVVTEAEITLSSGDIVNGEMVEYFYNNGAVRRFVLSSALPLIANPVLVMENSSVIGRLNNVGETSITRIQADMHGIQYNPYTGESTTYIQGNINL